MDVLVLNNRKEYFFRKYVYNVFEEVEEHHSVTSKDREGNLLQSSLSFLVALLSSRPDVVVIIGSGFSSFLLSLLGLAMRNTTVIFFHNDFTHAHLRDFKQGNILRTQIERLQEGGPLYLADALITMSDYHERYLRNKGIVKPFIRIPHGVYTDEFIPEIGADVRTEMGIGDDELAVGIVGTLNYSEKQGVGYGWTLIEAIAKLDQTVPVKAVLIGGGDGLGYFEDRIRELGIEDSVVLTGHIQHEDLPSYLGALDVGVLVKPDHPADKMAPTMKLPEYLSAGLYVIADDHAFASTILDKECASLIEYDGIRDDQFPQRLAEELTRLAADPDRIQRGQAHSRELAEVRFDYHHLQRDLREGIEGLFRAQNDSDQ